MQNVNDEILRILEKLKSDIIGYGKEIANFKKSFDKEKLLLINEIQELKAKHLAKEKERNNSESNK